MAIPAFHTKDVHCSFYCTRATFNANSKKAAVATAKHKHSMYLCSNLKELCVPKAKRVWFHIDERTWLKVQVHVEHCVCGPCLHLLLADGPGRGRGNRGGAGAGSRGDGGSKDG